jgi:hypothetical protein
LFYPQGSDERFQVSLTSFLLSQALPGANAIHPRCPTSGQQVEGHGASCNRYMMPSVRRDGSAIFSTRRFQVATGSRTAEQDHQRQLETSLIPGKLANSIVARRKRRLQENLRRPTEFASGGTWQTRFACSHCRSRIHTGGYPGGLYEMKSMPEGERADTKGRGRRICEPFTDGLNQYRLSASCVVRYWRITVNHQLPDGGGLSSCLQIR